MGDCGRHPYTYAEEIERLSDIHDDVLQTHAELIKAVKDILFRRFKNAGGCDRCGGRGWIISGDWGDSEYIYDKHVDYRNCDNLKCTPESRNRSGFAPYYSMFDKARGCKNPIIESDVFKAIVGPLDESLERMMDVIQELSYQQNNYMLGDDVVILDGDDPPIGTTWKISEVHVNGGLLLKHENFWNDANVTGVWVKRSRVAKLYKGSCKEED